MTDQPNMPFDPSRSLVYLTQKAFVFNKEGKFLTLLRTETAPTNPLKWDLPGGAYEIGEGPEASIRREIKEEAGLEVRNIQPIGVVGMYNHLKEWWVSVAYRAETENTEVTISWEHKDYKWVTKEEFLQLDISGKWRQVAETYLE